MDYALIPLLIGYTGTALLIISFLAQLVSIYRSKKVDNISHLFILLQLLVNIMFFVYNLHIRSMPLIVGNGSITILLVVMAFQKFYYSRFEPPPPSPPVPLTAFTIRQALETA